MRQRTRITQSNFIELRRNMRMISLRLCRIKNQYSDQIDIFNVVGQKSDYVHR